MVLFCYCIEVISTTFHTGALDRLKEKVRFRVCEKLSEGYLYNEDPRGQVQRFLNLEYGLPKLFSNIFVQFANALAGSFSEIYVNGPNGRVLTTYDKENKKYLYFRLQNLLEDPIFSGVAKALLGGKEMVLSPDYNNDKYLALMHNQLIDIHNLTTT